MRLADELLASASAIGRTAWPQVALQVAQLGRHAERAGVDPGRLGLYAADFFLVAAVLEGDRAALAAFDGHYVRPASGIAARVDSTPEFIEDVLQELRLKLLTGDEPKLLHYSAAGPLLAWIRVAALRTALNLKRSGRRLVPTSQVPVRDVLEAMDVEMPALRGQYLESLRAALEAGFRTLSTRERVLMRLHFLDGLGVEAIGTMYRVHRATAARWLVGIRNQLFEHARSHLFAEHGLQTSDLRSLYRALQRDLHLTISRLLATKRP
jgi:RNA polymerase sigma-70 factor, ECF subfamily